MVDIILFVLSAIVSVLYFGFSKVFLFVIVLMFIFSLFTLNNAYKRSDCYTGISDSGSGLIFGFNSCVLRLAEQLMRKKYPFVSITDYKLTTTQLSRKYKQRVLVNWYKLIYQSYVVFSLYCCVLVLVSCYQSDFAFSLLLLLLYCLFLIFKRVSHMECF